MPQVDLAYGPPARRGVTQLMAIGDDVVASPPPLEQAMETGTWIALGVAALGFATGNRMLRDAGGGAALALRLVRLLR